MTVPDLLEQPCNKSDNINKVATIKLLTIWDKQCEHSLLAELLQDARFLRVHTKKVNLSKIKFYYDLN
jgi:hypothetical protein